MRDGWRPARVVEGGATRVLSSPDGRRCDGDDVLAERMLAGRSPAIVALRRDAELVAATRSTVLVTGETGTGKGVVARLLHELSDRRHLPFVHVDCASLAASVIESELFGHERGSFTGAEQRRQGRFELAGRGTLLLDEVAELAPPLQAKLLRALEDRSFERVGGGETLPVRARIVAATNRDLRAEIAAGRFRADLYYRLQVFELALPPLRKRNGDIPILVRAGIERARGRGCPLPAIDPSFEERMLEHDWPGNVRELMNLVERLLAALPDGPWDAGSVDSVLSAARSVTASSASGAPGCAGPGRASHTREDFEAAERQRIALALGRNRWNVSATARSLGISRGALRARMARLQVR